MKMRFLVFALVVLLGAISAKADYIVNIASGSYLSDGISPTVGSFDLVLNLTAPEATTPPLLNNYSVRYTFNQPALTINSIDFVGSGDGGLNYSGASFISSKSASEFQFSGFPLLGVGAPVQSFDGAILARVNFTAAGGFSGPVAMTLDTAASTFNGSAPTGNSGSISIAAVPEPSSMALLGLGAFGLAFRRRRV